jgi:hypothetical protein
MIENLPTHMQRVCDGIAAECTERIIADHPGCNAAAVHAHIQQVLLDWSLGQFTPGKGHEAP